MSAFSLSYDDQELSPESLSALTARVAGALRAAGVTEASVVAVMLRNEPVYVALVFACRLLGAYLCSINWHFKEDEARWILTDSSAKCLVIHNDLWSQVRGALPPELLVIGVTPHPRTALDYQRSARDCQLPDTTVLDWTEFVSRGDPVFAPLAPARLPMPYTSGTTGRPKGVRRVAQSAAQMQARHALWRTMMHTVYGAHARARCLLAAPLYHSAPMSYLTAFASEGAHVVLRAKFEAKDVLATIERERISHVYLVATMYERLLRLPEQERRRYDLSSIVHVGSTGSPCPTHTKRAMIDWWGPVITESYASSELGYITWISAEESLQKPGSAGRVIGDAQLRILDEHLHPCPPNTLGTIYASQPAYPDFTYANNDAARRAIECDGLITLGDLGWLDEDGYLFVSGRSVDMVISGGVNIYPAEIEATVLRMPQVQDCAVFGVPDREFGEALVAAVQLREGYDGTREMQQEVKTFVQRWMAGYKVPREVIFCRDFPREETGKLFKDRLRRAYAEGTYKL